MEETSNFNLQCNIVTPEKQVFDSRVEMVVLNVHDGQIGILPQHSPLLCKLFPGILKIFTGSDPEYFFVAGGFAEVLNYSVTVLTPEVIPIDHLDKINIEDELSRLAKVEPQDEAERALNRKFVSIAEAKLNTFTLFKTDSR